MQNNTKNALEQSLRRLMSQKPISKITIQELSADCGISRIAFYYHFRDIYDLVEWVCTEDLRRALQQSSRQGSKTDLLTSIFDAMYEQKSFVLAIYRGIGRARMEKYLYRFVAPLLCAHLTQQCSEQPLSESQVQFITDFYKYSLVGFVLEWIACGMEDDYAPTAQRLASALQHTLPVFLHSISIS